MQITSLQLSGYYMSIYEEKTSINVLVVYRIIIKGFRISNPLKTPRIYSICVCFSQAWFIIAF